MKQRIWIFIFSIILCVILTGCIKKDERGQKQKVVYVVCRRSVIPVQLGKLIDEQKREAFHFTYTTGGFTYYVIGYGRQPGSVISSGCSSRRASSVCPPGARRRSLSAPMWTSIRVSYTR